ncbi:uncharacterized protein LOC108113714 [Drosophila eugracilis]|uniref:uncharacterized protein LOC108113714 n=1 Tax=Drosophila eugracilis TaxID=29029 RepID=UPI001BDA87CD|nr:uncharacterized protein LOC108113714 [Drosophila eugracilis]
MVKRYKTSRSRTASDAGSGSARSKESDQVYCVLLHVVEAINFQSHDAVDREHIVMNAALNTVDFEVEGTQSAETIIFNSNCIWECDLAGIKRIKTDHRPVKMTFYACRGGGAERKTVGTLLLPIRGIPVLNTADNKNSPHLKMLWHKLICISSEFRSLKPEVLLMLAIIKKSILHTKDFDHIMQFTEEKSPPTPPMQSPGHSITASMLQSQANVYVQSLVQLGLLQVGNDPLVDCDIIEVVLQLKQLKNVIGLIKSLSQSKTPGSVILVFDFVGNVTNIELKLNESDSYPLNDVLGLRFKTSLRSMRLYFQRIFYLPINMYMNGTAIANYRMNFTDLLPPDNYFSDNRKYTQDGFFVFNRFGRVDSGRGSKPPMMEYNFSVDLKTIYSRQGQEEPNQTVSGEVVRELPKESNDVTLTSQNTASSESLNVGAEISVSEETHEPSPFELKQDSDGPADLQKAKIRRKKSAQLSRVEPILDSDDEQYQKKKFLASVGREILNLNQKEKAALSKPDEINILSEESDMENDDRYAIRKPAAKESSKPKLITPLPNKSKIKAKESEKFLRESSYLPSPPVEINDSKNFEEMNSLDLFELEEKKLAMEAELEFLRRQMKEGQIESSQASAECQKRKTKIVNIEVQNNESHLKLNEVITKSPSKKSYDDKLSKEKLKTSSKTEVLLTKESLSKLRDKLSSKKHSESKDLVETSYEQSDEDLNYSLVLPEKRNSSKEKIIKKPRIKTVKEDTDLETDISLPRSRSRLKTKSKLQISEELEDLEDTSTSTKETRKLKTSKGDLNLRARWVEVNKVQAKALGETEKFLKETCPAELDEILFEDQMELSLSKPLKSKKKIVKTKQPTAKSVDYESSYKEEITFCKSKKDLLTGLVENPVHQVEIGSSEEYISVSEGNSIAAEIMYSETEHRDVRFRLAHPKKDHAKKLKISSGGDQATEMDSWASEEYAEGSLRSTTQLKEDRANKKISITVDEDQDDFKMSERIRSGTERSEILRVKKKKATSSDQQLVQIEFTSSEELMSVSEANVQTAELINPNIEHRDARILKKKVKKILVKEDPAVRNNESLEEEPVRPIKKKIIRKKSSVISDNIVPNENINLPEDEVHTKVRKIVKKKTKPVTSNSSVEENPKTKKLVTSQKGFKNLTTSEEDFSIEQPLNKSNTIGQKLKSWRRQQIDTFEKELARKELEFKSQLEEMESKEARRHEINKEVANLDETFTNNRTHFSGIDYEEKFKELEEHIALLKSEMEEQVKLFEDRSMELRQENLQLYTEKTELKVRIAAMEQQICDLKAQGSDEGDLKQVLGELRCQHYRYNSLARQKDLYRKRWRRSAKRVHALKQAIYERSIERVQDSIKVEPINLRQILTKDAMEFEREYGMFRQNGESPRYPFSAQSGSGDFSPPTMTI